MRREPSPSPRSSCYSSEPPARRSRSCITFPRSENRGEPSKRARPTKPCSWICSFDSLADRAFHLQLYQAVQLDGVLQRKPLGYWLDEAVDDHRNCLVLGVDLLLLDLDVRIRVRPRVLIQKQSVALDPALGVVAALVNLQKPAVRAPARPLGDGLGGDEARGVRRGVDDLAPRVLVLSVAGVGDGEDLTACALADQIHRRVLHSKLGA